MGKLLVLIFFAASGLAADTMVQAAVAFPGGCPYGPVNRTINASHDATYSAACGSGGTGQAMAHAEISLLEVSASTDGIAIPAQSSASARYTDRVTLPPEQQYAVVSLLLNGSITQTSGTGKLVLTLKAGSTSSQLLFSAPPGQTTTITSQVFTTGPILVNGISFRVSANRSSRTISVDGLLNDRHDA
jgi:hypothetical protein